MIRFKFITCCTFNEEQLKVLGLPFDLHLALTPGPISIDFMSKCFSNSIAVYTSNPKGKIMSLQPTALLKKTVQLKCLAKMEVG